MVLLILSIPVDLSLVGDRVVGGVGGWWGLLAGLLTPPYLLGVGRIYLGVRRIFLGQMSPGERGVAAFLGWVGFGGLRGAAYIGRHGLFAGCVTWGWGWDDEWGGPAWGGNGVGYAL